MRKAILLGLLLSMNIPGQWSPENEPVLRERIRKTLFVPRPLPELVPAVHGAFTPEPGVVAERVTYGTQFGMRVPAILYRPAKADGKAPGLIVVNGHGGDKYAWYSFYTGILYARAGAVVLTYDPIGEGERNSRRESGTRDHDTIEQPEELARRMGWLMMTDVIQAVTYLCSREEVDTGRIGVMGHSMGSFVVSLAGAVERRIKAAVLVGGGNLDGPDGYWDNSKPMCQGGPYRAMAFLGDRPAVIYAMHASRGSTYIYNGVEDEVVRVPQLGEAYLRAVRRRVVALRGGPDGVFETGFLPGASHRPFFVTRPVALWLENQLDLPNWWPAAIQGMRTTHIGSWVRETGVEVDHRYATEHRAGGTLALGEGVPALSREQLHALPAAEWERDKAKFIYEEWMAEAKRRLGR